MKTPPNLLVHQKKAFLSLKDKTYSAIFFEQGLGKTLLAIRLAEYWLNKNIVDAVVIVTRRSLISNWKSEFTRFSKLKVVLPQVNGNSVCYSIVASRNVYLMHYEGFSRELFKLHEFFEVYRLGLILDEAHYIKNPQTKNTKAVFTVSDLAVKRTVLTGTPIPNRPYDLWSICRFLDQELIKDISYSRLKINADLPSSGLKLAPNLDLLEQTVHRLRERLNSCTSFAFKASLPKIPKKVVQYRYISLPQNLLLIYKRLAQKLQFSQATNKAIQNECILERYTKLIRFCSNPGQIYADIKGPFPKDNEVLCLIKSAFRSKRSVIVWTSYNDTSVYFKRFIQHALPKANSYLVNGTISLQKRNEQINRFKQCKLGVLVATIGTCKEGLNLQNASLAIFVDSTYKLDDFLQAQDRIHRLNQKRDCQVIQLIYKSTIEVWINRLIALKHHVVKDVFDNSARISLPLAEQLFSEKEGIFHE